MLGHLLRSPWGIALRDTASGGIVSRGIAPWALAIPVSTRLLDPSRKKMVLSITILKGMGAGESLEEGRLNGQVEYHIPLLLLLLHLRNLVGETMMHWRSLRSLVVGMMMPYLSWAPNRMENVFTGAYSLGIGIYDNLI